MALSSHPPPPLDSSAEKRLPPRLRQRHTKRSRVCSGTNPGTGPGAINSKPTQTLQQQPLLPQVQKQKPRQQHQPHLRHNSLSPAMPPLASPSLILLLFALFAVLRPIACAAPTSTVSVPRRGHTATLIKDTVHFVGGFSTDGNPMKTLSSLDLTQLTFTETSTTLAIYHHSASSNRTLTFSPSTGTMADNSTNNKIAIAFGQTTATNPGEVLQWLDPTTGDVTPSKAGGKETEITMSPGGAVVEGRIGQSLVQFGNTLLILGGRQLRDSSATASAAVIDTLSYDLTAKTWTNRTGGLSRSGHVSARVGQDKVLTCYGNSTISAPLDSDCVFFTTSTSAFAHVQIQWANPADAIIGGRTGFTMVASPMGDGRLYLFGGRDLNGTFYPDVYQLDASHLPILLITKLAQAATVGNSSVPSKRAEHAAVTVGTTSAGFMVVFGGVIPGTVPGSTVMAPSTPFFFDMTANAWIDNTTFMSSYAKAVANMAAAASSNKNNVGVAPIIAGIMAGVAALGACVAYYIWSGLKRNEKERNEGRTSIYVGEDASPQHTPMTLSRDKSDVYPLSPSEEMAVGPFKSTTSLIQPEDTQISRKKSRISAGLPKPRSKSSDPYTSSGTTLNDNGSAHGYFSSSAASSVTPSRLTKNNSNGSSQYSGRQGSAATGSVNGAGAGATSAAYYNSQDLYLDDPEDDDLSMTVSLASESSTLSPWVGPVRVSSDLAPPNPRFSRGAIPQAHRQLVENTLASQRQSQGGYSNTSGWDTTSPGGSLSSREGDDERHRRSVNSMQWVGFEPLDLSTRPESGIFDPLSQQRSNLTVRNASLYGGNGRSSLIQSHGTGSGSTSQHQKRMSTYGGSNTSDSNTEDSSHSNRQRPFSGQGGSSQRISTALAARQQRRSFRNSQDSQSSLSAGASGHDSSEAFVTKVLPIITNKVTKPTLAKVVTQQRGSRIVVPSSEPLSDRLTSETADGLGIDFSSFSNDLYYQPLPPANKARRPSSTLNPSYSKPASAAKRESRLATIQSGQQQQSASKPPVILRMPPPPKHVNCNLSPKNNIAAGSSNQSAGTHGEAPSPSSGVRNSILELSQDMPGFLNYGENL
ncbi:hypothetical protein BGZ83_011626 [Gryganskiella cystojenkinii]|nr:hypothetical protein BGZ83_011626 [Gryganskiella cystojenkinii]